MSTVMVKLSEYAARNGYSVQTARRRFHDGLLPGAVRTGTGRIFVPVPDAEGTTRPKRGGERAMVPATVAVYVTIPDAGPRAIRHGKELTRACHAYAKELGWRVTKQVGEVAGPGEPHTRLAMLLADPSVTRIITPSVTAITGAATVLIATLMKRAGIELIEAPGTDGDRTGEPPAGPVNQATGTTTGHTPAPTATDDPAPTVPGPNHGHEGNDDEGTVDDDEGWDLSTNDSYAEHEPWFRGILNHTGDSEDKDGTGTGNETRTTTGLGSRPAATTPGDHHEPEQEPGATATSGTSPSTRPEPAATTEPPAEAEEDPDDGDDTDDTHEDEQAFEEILSIMTPEDPAGWEWFLAQNDDPTTRRSTTNGHAQTNKPTTRDENQTDSTDRQDPAEPRPAQPTGALGFNGPTTSTMKPYPVDQTSPAALPFRLDGNGQPIDLEQD